MRSSRLVSLDSGSGHLASLVDTPQVVVYPQRGDERRSVVLREGMPVQMRFGDMHRWNQRLCLPAWGGPSEVLAAIDGPCAPASYPALSTRHLADVPGWSAAEVIVVRETDRSLVMRCDRPATTSSRRRRSMICRQPHRRKKRSSVLIADCCRVCPHYRAGNDQCAMCGCAFVIAERVRSRVARCPEGRWP